MTKSTSVSSRVLSGLLGLVSVSLTACDAPPDELGAAEVVETRSGLSATGVNQRGPQFSSTPSANGDFAFAVSGPAPKVVVYPNSDGHASVIVDINAGRPAEIAPIGLSFPVPMEWGDFNGDGRDELVVGLPLITVSGESTTQGGFVTISFNADGSWAGNTFTRISAGWTDPPTNLYWGTSLAVGDFNGNGYDDLAVGNGKSQVRIYRGSSSGMAYSYAMTYGSSSYGFSQSLAAGDFNCDGYEDLAAGVPYRGAGQVVIMAGSSGQLAQRGTLKPAYESSAGFGTSLAVGNFNVDTLNGRPCIDLAVAAPNKTVSGQTYAGQVNVYPSQQNAASAGVIDSVYKEINQDTSGVLSTAQAGELFGNRIVVSDLNGDTEDDLAVETYMDVDITTSACNGDQAIQVFNGSSSGVQTASGRNFLFQGNGHNGYLGSTLGNQLAVSNYYYTDTPGMVCPDTHITLYKFNTSNYRSLTLSSTQSITRQQLGLDDRYTVAESTHTHPGYVR